MNEQSSLRSGYVSIQFQVFTTAASPTPYDFCIDAIRVLTEAP